MMPKRMFAGSVVLLLLSVSSLAAACDISCTFAWMNSDCHSRQTPLQDPSSSAMNMNGMDMAGMNMAGMAMPESADGEDTQSVSARTEKTSGHPSIGEMGPCERQACDNSSAVSTRTYRSLATYSHCAPAFLGNLRATAAPPHFHDARDDVASFPLIDASPLNQSLRI
ncbi:MAG: hypothetical protein LAO08_06870 [Acidobacteriia bacterium]|nr:hypothetical protein [Terriglobia bacterium]